MLSFFFILLEQGESTQSIVCKAIWSGKIQNSYRSVKTSYGAGIADFYVDISAFCVFIIAACYFLPEQFTASDVLNRLVVGTDPNVSVHITFHKGVLQITALGSHTIQLTM